MIPWTAAHQISLSFAISLSLLKLTSIESVMPSNHLIFCHPLLLLPSIFPTSVSFPMSQVFSNESSLCIRWTKYWSFRLISFRTEWFHLLAFQGTLKCLPLQFKSINSLVLSLLYGPTLTSVYNYWKNHRFGYIHLCCQSDISAF